MTYVQAWKEDGCRKVLISGHAGYAKGEGPDIVCSALSVLGQAAAQTLMDMEAAGKVENLEISIVPGRISVSARPKEGKEEKLDCILIPIRTGFELLSSAYPDHVRIGWASTEQKYATVFSGSP